MAIETVVSILNNSALLISEDPVKISRATVKKILRLTPFFCFSNFLLKRSFSNILKRYDCGVPQPFDFQNLQERLSKISLDPPTSYS